MNQCNGLHPIMNGDPQLHHLVVHGVKQGMTGAVRGIAGSPLSRPAKISGGYKTFLLCGLNFLVFFSALKIGGGPRYHPIPRDSPEGHFPHGLGCPVNKKPDHLLIRTPIRAFDRVQEVDVGAVAFSHGTMSQSCLHASLGCRGVRPPGGHNAQTDGIKTGGGSLNGHPLSRQPGTYTQNVSE